MVGQGLLEMDGISGRQSVIGFAGLGRMGTEMARNLANAGKELVLWNRTTTKAHSLADELACHSVRSPRDLSDACDIVVTMLADDASSRDVHLGSQGLFGGSRARLFLEMGTMSPAHINELAGVVPEGALLIDAPVSGATQAAADAQLMIMAGCSEQTAGQLAHLFSAMGKQTICLGKQGAGAVMKLAVNSLIHGINQTLAEAVILAEASGIAPQTAFDVIEASAACAPMIKYRRPIYLDEMAHGVTFTVALARKDLEVTAALASELGAPMPQGSITLQKLMEAEASGYADRDMASMLNFMREEKT